MNYNCVGIDFTGNNALVSYLNKGESEPTTVSMVLNEEDYNVPACVVKKLGIGQWLYGKEAIAYAKEYHIECEWNLIERAEKDEKIIIEGNEYSLQDLFYFYLKKLLALPSRYGAAYNFDYIMISLDKVGMKTMQLFWICMEKMKFPISNLLVMDKRESFCHYVMHQDEELSRQMSAMFDFSEDRITLRLLMINRKHTPKTISVLEEGIPYTGGDKDKFFLEYARENFVGKVISSVYLTGDGFDDGWMKQSLKYICSGRRVFIGKNLYTKGCCYAADEEKDYLYLGENEMSYNVNLKISERNSYKFLPLVEAGKNWYDQEFTYDIIVKGEREIDFWVQSIADNKPKIITYVLKDWPARSCEFTRIRISAKPISSEEIRITMKDMGFGEISASVDMTSEYILRLEK